MNARTKRVTLVAAAALLIGVLIAFGALAARPRLDSVPTATEVWKRTMSPFCPGITLAECSTSQSEELKDEIAVKVSQGWTNARIDEWLVATYGKEVLASPRGGLVWTLPALGACVIAALLLRVQLRTERRPRPRALTEKERALVDQDLARFAREAE